MALMHESGLTLPQLVVLHVLSNGAHTVSDLVQRVGLSGCDEESTIELRFAERVSEPKPNARARDRHVARGCAVEVHLEWPASVRRCSAGAVFTRIESRDACALNRVSDRLPSAVSSYGIVAKLVPVPPPPPVDR